jgi:pimeloyl-ACP methyl ester carboxylesterase
VKWFLVMLAACGASHPRVAALSLAPCRVAGVDEPLRCATLDVPEDRARPAGRHLALPIVVVPGRRDRGTPIFILLGGPGASASSTAAMFATQLAPLREVGDIVLVDQRGTGSGPSSLACPALDETPAAIANLDIVRDCRAALEARADLRFYGTLDAARDLDDARRALGYERINLDAVSYGTRVAQVYMRLYPQHVNAVVMFGALAMDVHTPAEFAENAQRVADQIVDDCAHDAACRQTYPKLREQMTTLVFPPTVDRTAFTEWVRHRIYSAQGASELPRIIAAAAAGDFSAFTSSPGKPANFRNAVLLAVSCTEDIPAIDLPSARSRAQATWFGAGRLEKQVAACVDWPHAPLPAGFYDPVSSDAPVLVFAGGRDPITPAAYAVRATQRMRHATIVGVPHLGHDPDGLVGVECIDGIERAFLGNPTKPVDVACVATTAAPKFR